MSAAQSGATVEHQQAQTVPVAQPTDMYIQPYLKKLIPELDGLSKLQEAEKRIDIYLSRKKIDLHQNITQWTHSKYTDPANNQFVRVFISNISENQPWQTNDETMELDQASWTLRIEGRLLDNGKADDPNRPKFSSFIESVAIDFKPVEEDQDDETDQEMGDPLLEGTQEPSAKKPKNEQTVFEWHVDQKMAQKYGTVCNWTATMIIGYIFPLLFDIMNGYAYFVFTIVAILLTYYIFSSVPETRNSRNFVEMWMGF